MAKKQFIRHLEYYGFPDQNSYSSDLNGVDLSDIREKNKEQDEEIAGLEGEKADKKDLVALSRQVDSLIDTQSEINENVMEAINGITSDIGKLKEIDNEYGEQLSALTDSINDVIDDVNELDDKIDGVEEEVAELSGKVETLSAETEEKFDEIEESLETKLDKETADETYLKKGDVYSKEEVDSKIEEGLEPYATKEWVSESGFMTQGEADSRYAKKETVNALSDRLNESLTDVNTKIYSISGNVAELSSTTNTRIGILETNFETLRGEVNRKVNEISGSVDTLSTKVANNTNAIRDLEDEVDRKANQSDLDNLESDVSSLSGVVDTKVSKAEFETYKNIVSNKFNDFDDKKADKSGVTAAMDAIEDTNDRIDQEIADRISGDENLQSQIDAIDGDIEDLNLEIGDYDERIAALESGLTKEIADRTQGDIDLIGTENDDKDDDTIWGAKKFAKYQKSVAVAEANIYTDDKITEVNSRIDQEHEWAEQNFSSAASQSYVNAMIDHLEDELETEIESSVEEETNRAVAAEGDLLRRIIEAFRQIGLDKALLDFLTNRVNAITSWEGTDPDEYVNTGNGVLDVLHREFHEYAEVGGTIKDIIVEDGNLIIVYYTKDGEKESVIPIASLVDLSNYYNIQQVDALLDEKLDATAYTDVTGDIREINEKLGLLNDALDSETIRATSAETALEEAISSVTSGTSELRDDLDDEIARATSAEGNLDVKIEQEIANRITDVGEEESRAISAEEALNDKIDNITIDCGIY